LAALNAGLEGARLGDPVGKALVNVADELRNLLARAADALGDHTQANAELEREREHRLEELGKMRDALREVHEKLDAATAGQELLGSKLTIVREEVERVIETDAETHELVSHAKGSSQALTQALSALADRGKLSDRTLADLLGPVLSALLSSKR
jgi:methyl-accepting chemotaxis protein